MAESYRLCYGTGWKGGDKDGVPGDDFKYPLDVRLIMCPLFLPWLGVINIKGHRIFECVE